ncbi:MAG: histidine kinase dimerization/phospho-acceptor domain-containing protein [Verrucomicrobiota bacterium]
MDSAPLQPASQEATPIVVAEKRDLLARLLGRLAHEIRNPLSSLDVHVQLLDEDLAQAAPATRQRLGIIRGELTRLEGIVKRFLRLASPSALELEDLQIDKLVGHVCSLLGPEAAARDVRLRTRVGADMPAWRADGVQLTQALLNLLINALQAVDRGG